MTSPDLHAWRKPTSGRGWIGFDPTSGLLAGEGHLAARVLGRSRQCGARDRFSPTSARRVSVDMHVTRIHEDPRSRSPIPKRSGGDRRARRGRRPELDAHDVRLTQGGSPRSCRWTTWTGLNGTRGAFACEARARADAARPPRVEVRHGCAAPRRPGQVVPGRAAAALGARHLLAQTTASPLWRDASRFRGHDRTTGPPRHEDADRFLRALALRSSCPRRWVLTRGRTCRKLLRDEAGAAVNVDPLKADLFEATERARLARLPTPVSSGRGLRTAAESRAAVVRPAGALDVESLAAASRAPVRAGRRLAARPAVAARLAAWVLPAEEDASPRRIRLRLPAPASASRLRARAARDGCEVRGAARGRRPRWCVEARAGHLRVFMRGRTASRLRSARPRPSRTPPPRRTVGCRSEAIRRRATRACRC